MNNETSILNLQDQLVWKTKIPTSMSFEMPESNRNNPLLIGNLLVYAVFSFGQKTSGVVALDATTGELRWSMELDHLTTEPGIYQNGTYFVSTARSVYGINIESGKTLWRFQPYNEKGEWIYQSLVLSGTSLLVGDRRGVLYGLDLHTGSPNWLLQVSDRGLNGCPLVCDGCIYLTANSAELVCVLEDGSRVLWRARLAGNVIAPVLLFESNLIIYDRQSIQFCSIDDGSLVWEQDFPGMRIDFVIVAQKDLVVFLRHESTPEMTAVSERDGIVEIVVIRDKAVVRSTSVLSKWVCFQYYDPSNDLLCIAHMGGLELWKFSTFTEVCTVATKQMLAAKALPCDNHWIVVTGSSDNTSDSDPSLVMKVLNPAL